MQFNRLHNVKIGIKIELFQYEMKNPRNLSNYTDLLNLFRVLLGYHGAIVDYLMYTSLLYSLSFS